MIIDGRKIASEIETSLAAEIASLKIKGIYPALAVILIGNDPSSEKYVSRKIKTGENLGIEVKLYRFSPITPVSELKDAVALFNNDPEIHGIIIQRPVPLKISSEELDLMVTPEKDVDGFHPRSGFDPPVALAVLEIIKSVYQVHLTGMQAHPSVASFRNWLQKQNILVIGRGVTAGKPIANYLKKINLIITIAHSQTENLNILISEADILISCVGKSNIVRRSIMKKNSILVGVGLHPEEDKLKPDYNQEELVGWKGFYTPVPGGVGPINVIMLLKNTIRAANPTSENP